MESHVIGPVDEPLLEKTIGDMLNETAARFPDNEFLVFAEDGIRLSYEEFLHDVEAFAAGFLALGLEPGDRVGVWAPNRIEWVITQFATAKAGLIQVNINPAYRTHELEYALNKVGCKALVLADKFKTSDYEAMLQELAPELATCPHGKLDAAHLPHLRAAITMGEEAPAGFFQFADIVELAEEEHYERLYEIERSLKPTDDINIQFTSGTTGNPKGATLSHHNILNNAKFVGAAMNLTSEDRLCVPVPLYHCFGMVMSVLACALVGATLVFPAEAFEPKSVLQAVEDERCTGLQGVPTMFIAELNEPNFKRYDLSSLRTGIMAGSPCPVEVMKRVISDMHMSECTIAYGMTETSPVSFQTARGDSVERRTSTVGRIHPHAEVKVIDEDGKTVPRGTQGQLCTRGYLVMRGYWDDADRTAEAIDADGWMHTGDLAVIDAEGYCRITGRVKDMVIRGGENIYPREVEEFLYTHPDIRDAQVFGIPDEKYGEELCAWLQLKEGAELDAGAIKAFCNGQIAHYKIPRHVRFVDEYPMTVTGKIQKFKMREAMMKDLGLAEIETA
ncbi:AMP-binding protein [Kordiimonas lacus]|uniref:3-methylmercaptopropionyl-CoA ligase n=1 Tax=Kordiimonas lacus TaxID=637679 RepID=A0A1G7EHN3_9PROT|nr:AMP-binding protein [Kordiimonas lacus]SDE62936.1 fatty-acyl-CoA synthase [Kordiimonas lacus]